MFYIVQKLEELFFFFATTCLIAMDFGSKCRIVNGKVVYIETSKLNIANM